MYVNDKDLGELRPRERENYLAHYYAELIRDFYDEHDTEGLAVLAKNLDILKTFASVSTNMLSYRRTILEAFSRMKKHVEQFDIDQEFAEQMEEIASMSQEYVEGAACEGFCNIDDTETVKRLEEQLKQAEKSNRV